MTLPTIADVSPACLRSAMIESALSAAIDIVHITSESNMVSVNIYNYTGQLMESLKLNERSYQINTSSFPAGVYSIKIETDDNIITKQLIIK